MRGKRVAIWGLAFKPDTDDIRESASLELIKSLQLEGATVLCYDPEALENAKKEAAYDDVHYVADKWEALSGADALVLMTHWDEFKSVAAEEFEAHGFNKIIIDCRNIWDRSKFELTSVIYEGLGR